MWRRGKIQTIWGSVKKERSQHWSGKLNMWKWVSKSMSSMSDESMGQEMFMLLKIVLRTYQVMGSFQPPISLGFLCHINTLIATNELLVWSMDIALQEIPTEMYIDQHLCIREWWWTRHEKGCMWCRVVPFAPWVGARYNWVFPVIVLGQGTMTPLICGMEINIHMCMPCGAQMTCPHWERVWRAHVSFNLESQAKPQGSPCTQCVCVICVTCGLCVSCR